MINIVVSNKSESKDFSLFRNTPLLYAFAAILLANLASISSAFADQKDAATADEAASDNIVILLSWDGMRHDFPDRGNYPALKRIESEGIRAKRLTPVSLSNTFPGHVSLATGVTPDVHGIVDNRFYDRVKGSYAYSSDANWINVEPIWITAERQGVKAATYFWVGSETDWREQGTSYRMAPFDGGRPEAAKVDKIVEWLDLPLIERPRLIMSYWRGADSTAHLKGPDHADVAEVIATQDEQLARLMQAIDDRDLWHKTTLMIVSDHGMSEVTESVAVKPLLEDAGLKTRIVGGGAAQHIFLESESDRAAVKALLGSAPHIEVLEGDDIPRGMSTTNRTGDLVVITSPPYTLNYAESIADKLVVLVSPLMGWSKGGHGYDPDLPDMGGIFFAMGHGVKKGKPLSDVHQLQIAPTVAALLKIQPPKLARTPAIRLD